MSSSAITNVNINSNIIELADFQSLVRTRSEFDTTMKGASTYTPQVSGSTSSESIPPSNPKSKVPKAVLKVSKALLKKFPELNFANISVEYPSASYTLEPTPEFDIIMKGARIYTVTPPDSGSASPIPSNFTSLETSSQITFASLSAGITESLKIEKPIESSTIYTPPSSPSAPSTPIPSGSNTLKISTEPETSSKTTTSSTSTSSESIQYVFYKGVVNAPTAGCRVLRRQLEGEAFEILVDVEDLEAKSSAKIQKTFSPEEKKKQIDLVDEWKNKILSSMND
ncbi:hypothetical protein L5515_001997 [Caenorhabditis briggsae]|uniref:Uncharacterized protein n=1 Tax=Caenorhabditis briggsae TaxID=6238 RepID=A0AAE9E6B8_CAEBR|nr:hypothetical protein L5515_001997 [Caenorhabditis briggsae]